MTEKIYGINDRGLGDCFLCINRLMNIALDNLKKVKLSVWTISDKNDEKKIKEVLDFLNGWRCIELVEDKPNINARDQWIPLHGGWRLMPSKYAWDCNIKSKTICYQFDGVWRGNEKTITPDDFKLMSDYFKDFELIKLNKEKSIDECGKLLSECRFFLGIDSGVAHLAYTVGCPMYLLRNNFFSDEAHDGKCAKGRQIFKNMNEFLEWIKEV